jgi:RNA polymerase sigma factor (TIGR02999 family)
MQAEQTPQAAPAGSADALFATVYDRLKAMAGRRLAAHGRDGTLDTTALVHELYLRVNAQGQLQFEHPAQFFTYAARAMRHLLCDRARERLSQRAGGDWLQITLTGSDERLAISSAEQAIALDAALQRLEAADARAARIVELRYFTGLSLEQAADALGIARRTAYRDWDFAQAFLKTDLA